MNNKIILYTTDCPMCKMLKNKLDAKKINYEVCTDVEKMLNLNIKTVPVIQLDNETLMSLREALK
jgi:glutaredoxin